MTELARAAVALGGTVGAEHGLGKRKAHLLAIQYSPAEIESMREVTKYVRQAMDEQRSGSSMISNAAERMIDMIHEIFQVAASQSSESEKIVHTMEAVRDIADVNRASAAEMNDAITLLNDAIRSLDEEVRKFRVRT